MPFAGATARSTSRWRRVLPAVLLGLALIALAAGFARAFKVDDAPRVPTASEEGIVAQVCQPPGEAIHARCAVVLPYGLEEIWAALTDYEHYGDICVCTSSAQIADGAAGACRIAAQGDTFLGGRLPFEIDLEQQQDLNRYRMKWTDTGGDVGNRGEWVLTANGPGQTLVELNQEVEVHPAPTFMVRAILLPRMRQTVVNLERRLLDGPSGKPW